MILELRCGTDRVEVEITSVTGKQRVRVNGDEVICDCVRLPDGQYSMILNGRVYDLAVDVENNKCHVTANGSRHEFGVADPRRLSSLQAGEDGGVSGLQRLSAEMPGKVVRVLVAPGDTVEYDQGLLVIEAMKMQNEIRSPKKGTIKEISVKNGIAVSTGDFLLSLE